MGKTLIVLFQIAGHVIESWNLGAGRGLWGVVARAWLSLPGQMGTIFKMRLRVGWFLVFLLFLQCLLG